VQAGKGKLMAKYIVKKKEIWFNSIEIEAESEEDAIDKVEHGEGEGDQYASVYDHTTMYDEWEVEKQ